MIICRVFVSQWAGQAPGNLPYKVGVLQHQAEQSGGRSLSLSLSTPPERMTALKEWTAAKKQLSTANAGLQQNVPGWWEVGGEVGGVIVAWWRSEEFVDENASVSALEKKVH